MFSIAAINETDSSGLWEPLAPTKEAQEFHVSQTYHEGLLKLQAKDYAKARELLETVLKDPLVSSAQIDDNASDRHLLQLRFLSLKNLAAVFLQQGSMHYESALHCYLQAVEIDANDSVVWNQLGTLSCTMGLMSTSRWAFEQGLLCSPNNWNCMEKLLEVLIAIGDEVACLSVANLILRHWPSHSRALHVKNTIEDAEPVPFAPRGVDKLEPKHVRLKFPDKRKLTDDEIDNSRVSKRCNQNIELQLTGATWSTLVEGILCIFLPKDGKISGPGFAHDHDDAISENLTERQGKVSSSDTSPDKGRSGIQFSENMGSFTCTKIDIRLATAPEIILDPAEGKTHGVCPVGDNTSLGSHGFEKSSEVKEKDVCTDRDHPQERRSTRLERLRSRKSGKEDLEAGGKDLAKVAFRFLEPFILKRQSTENHDSSSSCDGSRPSISTYTPILEHNDVVQFISKASKNCGAYHIGHLILEEVAHKGIPFHDSFIKFLELEKLTRHWGQDRSPLCSLFLAELYYDQGSWSANKSKQSEFFLEASYHLCKVIELVSLDSPHDLVSMGNHFSGPNITTETNDPNGTAECVHCTAEEENMPLTVTSQNATTMLAGDSGCQEISEQNSILTNNSAFWVRFFWLSGHLSLFSGSKAKAFNEFSICLSLLRKNKKFEETKDFVFLPHCKLVNFLTVDRVLHEINLLKLDSLLRKITDEMIEKGMYTESIKVLAPLLLSTKDVYLDVVSGDSKESETAASIELSALNVLMSSCEKAESMDIQVYLNCHRRKLQVLTVAAGMIGSPASQTDKSSLPKASAASDLDISEPIRRHWIHMLVKEVEDISQSATQVKNSIDQNDTYDEFSSLVCIIASIQSLLLTVMCSAVRIILSQKSSSSGTSVQTNQMECLCLVDAAIAFCKLQHIDPTVSVKTQVDLIVAVHDLLAEYGLCCAGKDGEGEEGTFLKFAIKHLLSLDVKLKSLNGTNGKEEIASPCKNATEDMTRYHLYAHEEQDKVEEGQETGKNSTDEIEKVELGIDNALDQSFFCLYGLKINPDSSSEDDLAVHKNTSRGDYQTKEQCADVFQYILPYARSLSRAGLVKLRRVLRAIRKHFPQPPDDILADNVIDKFLDGPDLCENKLCEIYESNGNRESIMNILFSNGRDPETFKKLSVASSEPYLEVYCNLYYFIAQAEEISATDKYPGFVLKKEGEEFVEQNANLFKCDLLYNPLRFESWQKLANIYDEEVDLLLNDGSKHINILDWRKNTVLPQRVEMGRRRSRRCLLMSLALAATTIQQSQIHELLALVYYDSLQNVVPFYDQRSLVPTKDTAWMTFCQNSMKHFERAFALTPEWLHAFYLGKLCEKMGHSPAKAFSYYSKAASLNPSAVDPVYRMHASRLKLLYTRGKQNLDVLQIVAAYPFNQSTKDTILNLFSWTSEDLLQLTLDVKDVCGPDVSKDKKSIEPHLLDKAWYILYDDCLSALAICVEGELKHFHKARYMLAQGLYKRGAVGDLERAKDELSFCFKSSRSSFTVNMWEIDGMVRKGRRRNPGVSGNKKSLEVSLSESSRKFITCIRKYMLLYLNLLEKTGDLWTLERAYTYLRTDKRFSLCLGDIVPVALGKYIQVLTSSIRNAETRGATDNNTSLEQLLEKMFHIFMDHVNLWTDISSLPEVNNPDLSESNLYGYIHQYIHLLESDIRLDAIEGINEKIRKRFKNPKLSNNNFSKICKHASLAWCRSILIKLASITPLPDAGQLSGQPSGLESGLLLFVDLQPDELLVSPLEGPAQTKGLDMNWFEALYKIKNIRIRQALEENMEAAVTLMRCTYNFYRESSCGTFPSGINLYTVFSLQSAVGGLPQQGNDVVDVLDLSIPRKLLLWAYTLVHGRYSNISAVVKYCEEAKSRMKKGIAVSSAPSQGNIPTNVAHAALGGSKEKMDRDECSEAEGSPSVVATSGSLHQEGSALGSNISPVNYEAQKPTSASSQLHRCNSNKGSENVQQDGCRENMTD
ncbi:calcineurin-binding protein 1 [Phoenix dactylifera]|uniref:Calcineurin-binding protein 1 n=1 Tax=Phoenix dactylifera TaxID=42345 RepID=A0A8B7CD44_PHODC|nr:calcineurin-binding protein 1 [Phoenix dactylifera]